MDQSVILSACGLNLYYGENHALKDISIDIKANKITALIGPSGCGKSTFLRTIDRMNDLIPSVKITGSLHLPRAGDLRPRRGRHRPAPAHRHGVPEAQPLSHVHLRQRGLRPPHPWQCAPRLALDELVEKSLRQAAIWDEVKDRLKKPALGLSGGQQQRLCIARALAVQPEVLLMDEATSALDPISTSKIEDLAMELKSEYTIVMVTHNMQQAARVSDQTAFFLLGDLVEYGDTEQLFSMPQDKRTEDYITGRFG